MISQSLQDSILRNILLACHHITTSKIRLHGLASPSGVEALGLRKRVRELHIPAQLLILKPLPSMGNTYT